VPDVPVRCVDRIATEARILILTAALQNTIETCAETRSWLANEMSKLLGQGPFLSEEQFASAIATRIRDNTELHSEGGYAPPPAGIAALFRLPINFHRLIFDTLRKEEYWPCVNQKLEMGSAGLVYASPIHRLSGAIGDFGMTIYRGNNAAVQAHLSRCLNVLERACEYAEVGMEFRELHELAQHLFEEAGLHNARTVTWTDKVGTNLGHTIPWSYEAPSQTEMQLISSGTLSDLRSLISNKRINVNRIERFRIPENIAFTLEARLESASDPTMPNTFYQLIATFQNGVRRVCANFNEIFAALGMESYIRSKF